MNEIEKLIEKLKDAGFEVQAGHTQTRLRGGTKIVVDENGMTTHIEGWFEVSYAHNLWVVTVPYWQSNILIRAIDDMDEIVRSIANFIRNVNAHNQDIISSWLPKILRKLQKDDYFAECLPSNRIEVFKLDSTLSDAKLAFEYFADLQSKRDRSEKCLIAIPQELNAEWGISYFKDNQLQAETTSTNPDDILLTVQQMMPK